MLKTFRALKESGEYRRKHLPFLQTLEDQDLLREIGFNEAVRRPIGLKQLLMRGIASPATVQRRLNRLKRLGMVAQSRAAHDKRVAKLTLTPLARKLHLGWIRALRK
jgi:DNA-binding MarR family transcriptional regulator